MKVAITGISSRFAEELVSLLERDDNITHILGIDRMKPKVVSPKITFAKRDVRDRAILQDMKGYDAIVHLAFVYLPPIPRFKEVYSINVDGSRNVFNCAREAGVRKIVYASSVASYGAFPDNPMPIKEDHPLRLMEPPFYYNETKFRVEKLLDVLEGESPETNITRIRACTVTGRYFSPILSRRLQINPSLAVPMQFVWVDDVVQAFYLALQKEARGAFNIAGDNPLSWREINAQTGAVSVPVPYHLTHLLVKTFFKLRLQKRLPPGWLRMSRYPIVVDCEKAKASFGWKPRYDTRGAVLQWYGHSVRGHGIKQA